MSVQGWVVCAVYVCLTKDVWPYVNVSEVFVGGDLEEAVSSFVRWL